MARFPIAFGRHLLLERINVGGMAEVFKAKAFGVEGFERIVAVKRILPTLIEDDEFTTMFIDEARIAAHLTHQNIVQIYELQKHNGLFFISMEYIAGRDLRQILDSHAKPDGPPRDIARMCHIACRVLEALEYAHGKRDPAGRDLKIVHRDVTPQNVIISYEGEVKLCDFGIAKAATRVGRTQVGVLKGKFAYMPPEQVRGQMTDHRGDLFSLGVVFYEMLTGHRLFVGESDYATLEAVREAKVPSPRQYNPEVTPELEEILMRLLARDPQDRYSGASEALEALLDRVPTNGRPYHRRHLREWMQATWAREIAVENASLVRFMELRHPGRAVSGAPKERSPSSLAAAILGKDADTASGRGVQFMPSSDHGAWESEGTPEEYEFDDDTVAAPEESAVLLPDDTSDAIISDPADSHDLMVSVDDDSEGEFEHADRTEYEGPIEYDGPVDYNLIEDNPTLFDQPDRTDSNPEGQRRGIEEARAQLFQYLDEPPGASSVETVDLSRDFDPSVALDPNTIHGVAVPPILDGPETPGDDTVLQEGLTKIDASVDAAEVEFDGSSLGDDETPEDGTSEEEVGTVEEAPLFPGSYRPAEPFDTTIGSTPDEVFASDAEERKAPGKLPPFAPQAPPLSGRPGLASLGPRRIVERVEPPRGQPVRPVDAEPVAVAPVAVQAPDLGVMGQPRVLALLVAGVVLLSIVLVTVILTWSRPREASLLIQTEPEGSFVVRVDDRTVGDKTPISVEGLKVGPHRLEVEAPGYRPFLHIFHIEEARPHRIAVKLTPVSEPDSAEEDSESSTDANGSKDAKAPSSGSPSVAKSDEANNGGS